MSATHARSSSSGSSYLTNLSDIGDDIEEMINNATFETLALVDMAERILGTFAKNKKRFLKYPSNIKLDKAVDPHRVLLAMLKHAPSEKGKRYIAAAIVVCNNQGDVTMALVGLADTYVRYLLLLFKGNTDLRGDFEPSPLATPTIDKTYVQREAIERNREATFREAVIKRDGYKCMVEPVPTYEVDHVPPGVDALVSPLAAAHILKRAVGVHDPTKENACLATWDIISHYTGWTDTLAQITQKVDSPENGLMLSPTHHACFDRFLWALKPELNSIGEFIPNTYRIDIVGKGWGADSVKKLEAHVIRFVDHSTPAPPPVDRSRRHPVQPHPGIPLPNPEYFALHRAVAHVLHMSGAAEAIDLTFHNSKDKGLVIPSHKIRDADDLAAALATLDIGRSFVTPHSGPFNVNRIIGD